MRTIRCALLVVAILMLATPSHAFNGLRKGFVLGGGLGIAPASTWHVDAGFFGETEESKAGGCSNIMLGYGWDEHNLLVFEGNGASILSDKINDATIFQGYAGPVWYHYFSPSAPGFFTTAGVGVYSFYFDIKDGEEDSNDSGYGLLGGAGYEFARHWQVSFVINGGRTTRGGLDFSHVNLEVLIGGVAF